MKLLFTLICCLSCLFALEAQVSLVAGTPVTIDFDNTVPGVNNGTFDASGISATPGPGELDSDAFSFVGAGSFRGMSSGGVSTGGIYAFSGAPFSGAALGVQPTGSVFTPGSITVTGINDGTQDINSVEFSVDLCVLNDQDRGNDYTVLYSTDNGGSFTAVGSITTPETSTPTPFVCSTIGPFNVGGLTIAPGGTFLLRITGDDNLGGGSRDEVAIDNIIFTPSAMALPVNLTHFTATPQSASVLLDWQTAKEVDNDYFTVERSLDGKTFEIIGMVAGNGTTEATTDYRFMDDAPATGINYYRLSQTDYDGRSESFAVRSVQITEAIDVNVFPNPVSDRATLDFGAELTDAELTLTDWNGRPVLRRVASGTRAVLDLQALPAGAYTLSVRSTSGVRVLRLVKL